MEVTIWAAVVWITMNLRQNFQDSSEEGLDSIIRCWLRTTSFQHSIRRNSKLSLKSAWHLRYSCFEFKKHWIGTRRGHDILHLISIQFDCGTPGSIPTFALPDGVTRADLGRKMVDFPLRRNFLDHWVFDLQWLRPRGLWGTVLAGERGAGIVHEGNLLDWRFTQFPQVLMTLETFLQGSDVSKL